jgi:hypothetical protein
MAAATFGDLLALGREHLDPAAGLPDSALRGEPVIAAAPVIGRLALTLSRYLADIAPYTMAEVITSRYLSPRMRAAVAAREALHLAGAGLRSGNGHVGDAEPVQADPLSAGLAAAATFLAAGRDLLHTHFAAGSDGRWEARSGWSAVVMSAPVTWMLTAEVARWSRQLAFLTARLSAVCEADRTIPAPLCDGLVGASGGLLAASAAITGGQRDHPAAAIGAELLEAIPVNTAPARQVHSDGETIGRLAGGVAVSAARLRVITHAAAPEQAAWSAAMTADGWQWSASATAVAFHVSALMLRSLAGDGGPASDGSLAADSPGLAAQLDTAAETAAGASARWREVAKSWSRLTTEARGRSAPGMADARDLVILLGRIAFTDPGWTPARARRAVPRALGDLAPDTAQAAVVVSAIHDAADTLACVAAADLRAVRTAIRASRLLTLTRRLPEEVDVPYRYGNATHVQAAELVDTYRAACAASEDVVLNLDALTITTNGPSRILAMARAAIRSPSMEDVVTGIAANGQPAGLAMALPGSLFRAVASPPGAVEEAVRKTGTTDPGLLLRAHAIDRAALQLVKEARELGARDAAENGGRSVVPAVSAARVAASSFPAGPVIPASGRRAAGPSLRAQPAVGDPVIRPATGREHARRGRL